MVASSQTCFKRFPSFATRVEDSFLVFVFAVFVDIGGQADPSVDLMASYASSEDVASLHTTSQAHRAGTRIKIDSNGWIASSDRDHDASIEFSDTESIGAEPSDSAKRESSFPLPREGRATVSSFDRTSRQMLSTVEHLSQALDKAFGADLHPLTSDDPEDTDPEDEEGSRRSKRQTIPYQTDR